MLKFLVSYVAFHPDNHQGGSGNSFQFKKLVEIPGIVLSDTIMNTIKETVLEDAKKGNAYSEEYDFKVAIQKIELLV